MEEAAVPSSSNALLRKNEGEDDENMAENEYVFQLPATVIWDLAAVLDAGNVWEEVGELNRNLIFCGKSFNFYINLIINYIKIYNNFI